MNFKTAAITVVFCFFANLVWAVQADNDSLRSVQRQFLDDIKPLLQKNCGDCHWGNNAEAELDFLKYESLDQMLNDSTKWKKVVLRVTEGDMPPEDSDPLPNGEKSELLSWLDQLLNTVDCSNINPGRVTIRRLNRTEYQNTIRDLVGLDYQPSQNFPGDDVGYGFDNIGDVLSLPPILMEKYLDAAESITAEAVVDPTKPAFSKSFAGKSFRGGRRARNRGNTRVLTTNATVWRRFDIPKTGEYVVKLQAFGDQADDEPCKVRILVDGQRLTVLDVPATEEKVGEYELKIVLEQGSRKLSVEFLNDFYDPDKGLDRNLHIYGVAIRGPINPTNSHQKIIFSQLQKNENEEEFVRKILKPFVGRAFRRPVSSDELDRLVKLYALSRSEGDSLEAAIRLPLQAVLVSPHFLFKIETPPEVGETRRLNAFETATSLAYFLWSTMPDDELSYLAHTNELLEPKVYRDQVSRLLKNERSQSLVDNFAVQWLQLRALQDFQPDPDLFPGVDAAMRSDMITETKLLFADVLKRDGSVLELLNSKYTFVNQRLAEHYGLNDVTGDEFVKVNLDGFRRGGLLTQASILTLTSNPTRTSPVKRGKWILENLLGEEPTFPDPDVMALEDQSELTGSLRERMEQHRKDPSCAACHLTMDALGFSLEHYDAVGRWRDNDDDLPINASGELPDGTEFSGANGLQKLVSTNMKDQFLRCFTEKLLMYSLGRGLEYYDECTVDKILEIAAKDDYRLSSFIHAITECEPFLQRRGVGKSK